MNFYNFRKKCIFLSQNYVYADIQNDGNFDLFFGKGIFEVNCYKLSYVNLESKVDYF